MVLGRLVWALITVPEGFRTLSHARAIYSQTMIDVLPIIGARPPFGNKFRKNIIKILGSI